MTDISTQQKRAMNSNLGLLSYSSCCLLHSCPRKFQLYKLLNPELTKQERDIHTDFGNLVGYGIQVYLITKDKDLTYLRMLSTWTEDLDDEDAKKDKKTFFHALLAIDKFTVMADNVLRDYEVVIFDEKSAAELGFSVSFFDNFKYRGYMDLLLVNKFSREFLVIECKTTKFKKISSAQYKNSAQGLGYSLVVDAIASALSLQTSNSFEVLYPVWSTAEAEWNVDNRFPYSYTDRAKWLRNVLLDVKHIAEFAEEDHFPQHGESCYSFFKECEYLDICGMSDASLQLDKSKEVVEEEDKYQFHFSLEEIINAQIEKHTLVNEVGG